MDLSFDEILQKIMTETGLTKEEVFEKIQEKIQETGGIITQNGAIHLVAVDLNVDLSGETTIPPIQIQDLTEGMNNITLILRITDIYDTILFDRKDGTKGAVRRLRVLDGTGQATLVLWDHATRIVEDLGLQSGDAIKLMRAYTKLGKNGNIEIHFGSKARIELINDPDLLTSLPEVSQPPETSINELNNYIGQTVKLQGKIIRAFDLKTFTRSDGTTGQLRSFIIHDGTGSTRIVLWGTHADNSNITLEACVQLTCLVKKDEQYDRLECHSTNKTTITPISCTQFDNIVASSQSSRETKTIATIEPSDSSINVYALLIEKQEPRVITAKNGAELPLMDIVLKDPTGIIPATVWAEKIAEFNDIQPSTPLLIKNAQVRENTYLQSLTLSIGKYAQIVPNPPDFPFNSENIQTNTTPLADLTPGTITNAQGRIIDIQEPRTVTLEDKTSEVLNLTIEDPSGQAQVTAWDSNIQKLEPFDINDWILLETVKVKENDYGKDLIVTGTSVVSRAKPQEYSEFMTADQLHKTLLDKPSTQTVKEVLTQDDGTTVKVQGVIVKFFEKPILYYACSVCKKKIDQEACPNHPEAPKEPALTAAFVLDSDGETIVIRSFTAPLTRLLEMTPEDVIAYIKRFDDPLAPIMKLKEEFLLKPVIVTGRIQKSTTRDEKNIIASRITPIDFANETKTILTDFEQP